jgi:uncharacterized protein YqeY
MTLETLQSQMIVAMKNKDKLRKSVLSGLVDAVKKAAIDKNCRDNITEALVDEVLLKYKKLVQEQVDTCPADRVDTLVDYKAQLAIVAEFAPTLITNEVEIQNAILDAINGEIEFSKVNKGKIMKIIAPIFKGKADMGIVNKVLGEMLK